MLNKEKYINEVLDILFEGEPVAIVNGKPCICGEVECRNCALYERDGEDGSCERQLKMWLNEEYKEPLKPCPFCGSENIEKRGHDINYYIECAGCRATTSICTSRDESIRAWNRRASDED